MASDAADVLGVVLAGGRSRRMGVDKALIEVGGRSLIRRVADALVAGGTGHAVAVGGPDARHRGGLEVWADDHPGSGPLGAVVTALHRAGPGTELVVVAPCDWIHPDPEVVRGLLAAARATGATVTVPMVDGRPQWIHAVWRTTARDHLAAAFARGERALFRAACELPSTASVDCPPGTLDDADTPDDLRGAVGDDVGGAPGSGAGADPIGGDR